MQSNVHFMEQSIRTYQTHAVCRHRQTYEMQHTALQLFIQIKNEKKKRKKIMKNETNHIEKTRKKNL